MTPKEKSYKLKNAFSRGLLLFIIGILLAPRNIKAQSTPQVSDGVKLGILAGTAVVVGGIAIVHGIKISKNSIRNKKLTSVELFSNKKPLNLVNEGSLCAIDILAIDHKSRRFHSSIIDSLSNTPYSDWEVEVIGGKWLGDGLLKIDDVIDLDREWVDLTLISKYDSQVKYQFHFKVNRIDRFLIKLNEPKSELLPGGFFSFEITPRYLNEEIGKRFYVSPTDSAFSVEIKNGKYNKYNEVLINPLPFGIAGHDTVKVVLSNRLGTARGEMNVILNYESHQILDFDGYNGANGQDGRDGDSTQGPTYGTSGYDGGNGHDLLINIDTYITPKNQELVLMQIIEQIKDTSYVLCNPKTSFITVSSKGGDGGDGGHGGNGRIKKTAGIGSFSDYCGEDAGSGASGGHGGNIQVFISPEAYKINLPMKFIYEGGHHGKKGFGGTRTGILFEDGEDGGEGNNGNKGSLRVSVTEVEIKLP